MGALSSTEDSPPVKTLFRLVRVAYNRLIVTHGIEETMVLANQFLTTLDKDPIYRSISL